MAKQTEKSKELDKYLELRDGKWHVVVNGVSHYDSPSKWYAKQKVEQFLHVGQAQENKARQFPINERFGFIIQIVDMIAKKQVPSLIITGDGGLGKTYTVQQGLKKAGLKDISAHALDEAVGNRSCFRVIKGYSSAKGLYRVLFENQNQVVVFDDCDDVMKDPTALMILKGALDSYDKRIITWNIDTGDDLPRQFTFNGAVIFISNRSQEQIDQALRTRAICIDLSMTPDQKIERMEAIVSTDSFLPDVNIKFRREALELLREHRNSARELSLRSLITIARIRNNDSPNWKKLAEYALLN